MGHVVVDAYLEYCKASVSLKIRTIETHHAKTCVCAALTAQHSSPVTGARISEPSSAPSSTEALLSAGSTVESRVPKSAKELLASLE
jgi:hypothetical protein